VNEGPERKLGAFVFAGPAEAESPMRAWLMACLVAGTSAWLSCAAPPCEQPLSEYCAWPLGCGSWDAHTANLVSPDAGDCPALVRLSICEGHRVMGVSGTSPTEFFFDADGGLVGVRQGSDVGLDCGVPGANSYRTFGRVFDCSGAEATRYCFATGP
jgi:hypothetical protein